MPVHVIRRLPAEKQKQFRVAVDMVEIHLFPRMLHALVGDLGDLLRGAEVKHILFPSSVFFHYTQKSRKCNKKVKNTNSILFFIVLHYV